MIDQSSATPYSPERFRPYRGDRFEIVTEQGPVEAELTSVEDARAGQFSVIWRGPRDRVLPQQIYQVLHPQLGALDLFLVTVGPDAEGMRYQAVFT